MASQKKFVVPWVGQPGMAPLVVVCKENIGLICSGFYWNRKHGQGNPARRTRGRNEPHQRSLYAQKCRGRAGTGGTDRHAFPPTAAEVYDAADVVIVAVKPIAMASALSKDLGKQSHGQVIVSVAAGLSLATLAAHSPARSIVRARHAERELPNRGWHECAVCQRAGR